MPDPVLPWRLPTRVAFRFAVLYFVLYVCTTQMLGSLIALPIVEIPTPGPLRSGITWVAAHVFGVTQPLVIDGSGSGDKIFDWVQVFCLLIVAAAGTTLWSLLDRRRLSYERLQPWFRLFARFALGATMISYGIVKAIPLQMPAPDLVRLVEPFGNLSPMGVLWASIGASSSYETFAGCAELAGGIVILLPRLSTLGALICLLDCMQIFMLNMTYDVPVKLFSFHLIVLSLVVLAPELSRLTSVIVLNRAAGASTQLPVGRTLRGRRIATWAQVAFATYVLSLNLWGAQQSRKQYGDLAPTTPLKGIWAIDAMTVDGESRPPQGSSAERWRRVIIPSPRGVVVQNMDDSFAYYRGQIDLEASTITLTGRASPKGQVLRFTQPAPTRLVLDGMFDGHTTHVETSRLDHTKFQLLSRGFHWVQEYPFNR